MPESILRVPDAVTADQMQAAADGETEGAFCAGDVRIRMIPEGEYWSVYVSARTTPVRKIRLRWNFARRLKGRVLGGAWERTYGDAGWHGITPYEMLPWYALIQTGSVTAGYGVLVRPAAVCGWQIDPEGITLWLDVRCGGEGVELKGRDIRAAQVVYREYAWVDPLEASKQFCREMCHDPLLPDFPVYGANNWYYAYGKSSREDVIADAAYLAKLAGDGKNRPFFVIDDGWQRDRYRSDGTYEETYNGGPWLPNERFGDMGKLAQKICEHGVRPGIWVRLLQDRNPDIPASWRLQHTGGLDPSIPEVLEYVSDIVDRIGGWGFQLLKHDFSTFDMTNRWGSEMPDGMTEDGWSFADRSRTTAEIILSFYEAVLRSAEKHGMLILGCNTVGHLGAGLMHMQRTGDDTSGLIWDRTLCMGVNTLAFCLPQHGSFFDIDADCIGISDRIPWDYNRQWGTLLSKSGTSLFYSARPNSLSPEQERELSQMLRDNAAARAPAEPLDWQDTPLPQEWLLDGEKMTFHWYEPSGLRVACDNGPVWEKVWKEVSGNL